MKEIKLTKDQIKDIEQLVEECQNADYAYQLAVRMKGAADKKLWEKLYEFYPESKTNGISFNYDTKKLSF